MEAFCHLFDLFELLKKLVLRRQGGDILGELHVLLAFDAVIERTDELQLADAVVAEVLEILLLPHNLLIERRVLVAEELKFVLCFFLLQVRVSVAFFPSPH